MKLIMTLLVKNEVDIVEYNIKYHLMSGVDKIICMDNGSSDGTKEILLSYAKLGKLEYLLQNGEDHDQSVWVTMMAKIAYNKYKAEWVFHADADEFWVTKNNDLKKAIKNENSDAEMLYVKTNDFIISNKRQTKFYNRMLHRKKVSNNCLGFPQLPKIIHKGSDKITIKDGNHDLLEKDIIRGLCNEIEIYHFPIRSYAQFERKIVNGTIALSKNKRIKKTTGETWKHLYEEYRKGRLIEWYNKETLEFSKENVIMDLKLNSIFNNR